MTKLIKYPVSERALIQRLNRALARDELQVKKTRGRRAFSTLGEYFLINPSTHVIGKHNLSLDDLVDMAKDRGVMAKYEKLVSDEEGGEQ